MKIDVLYVLALSHSWYGDYTNDVLLSTTLGVSQENIEEHRALVAAVANTFTPQQTGRTFNSTTLQVLLCKLIIY